MSDRLKRLPIPGVKTNILKDWEIPMIDRVELAEQCRNEYSYSQADMIKLTGISYRTYTGLCTVLSAKNPTIRKELVDNTISLQIALMKIKNPEYIEDRGQYPFLERVKSINAEIIYADGRHILYRFEQNVFLGIAYSVVKESRWGCREMLCLMDDAPYALDTTIRLIKDGYAIFSDLTLHKKACGNIGALQHHIMAAYGGISLEAVRKAMVSFKQRSNAGIKDLRICNMFCRAVPHHITPDFTGGYKVMKHGNEIRIITQNTGTVITADYSDWLYDLLQEKKGYLKLQSRDNRLCVPICGSIEYLYHIVMAVHILGVPTGEETLGEKLRKFRSGYLFKGMQVDHLDNDCDNNHLNNLIIMTKTQHYRKNGLEKSIKNLGLPYFCWAERYDDKAVTVRAGILGPLKSPTNRLYGVYSIDEYLAEAERFIYAAREEFAVCEAFYEFEGTESEEND